MSRSQAKPYLVRTLGLLAGERDAARAEVRALEREHALVRGHLEREIVDLLRQRHGWFVAAAGGWGFAVLGWFVVWMLKA